MRSLCFILFLPVIMITASSRAIAQTVSLGDPIFTYDFGSGTNPGPPLGLNPQGTPITTMTYTADNCPPDGSYTLINSFPTSGTPCHTLEWHQLTRDHSAIATNKPGGYMMLINASQDPSVFFTYQTPSVLCGSTNYQFSVWVLNLLTPYATSPTSSEPNISFDITGPNGEPVGHKETGTINSSGDAEPWIQYTCNFSSGVYPYVIVKMTNKAPGGGGNDLVIDDIQVRAYGPVINPPQQSGFPQAPPNLCEGDTHTYHYSVYEPNGTGYNKSQWQKNINGTGWVDMPGEIYTDLTFTIANAQPGTYQYRLGLAIGNNINSAACRIYSPPIVITVNPANPPVSGVLPSESECEGDILTLAATGGSTYLWTGPNMQPTTTNPLIIPNLTISNSGTYTVTAYTTNGCSSPTFPTKVTVHPKAQATATGGKTVCLGTPVPLTATGGVTYLWSPGAGLSDSTVYNPIATPSDNTTYTVTVTDANLCSATASTTVNVIQTATADAGPDKVIFAGQSVQLNGVAQNYTSVSWTPTEGLSDPNSLTPIATPANDITYTLHAVSANDCGITNSSVFIRVYQKIIIPNTFSPNGDNFNDKWDIEALSTYPQSIMQVFNRNGQLVFKSTGYTKPWDGTFNGKPMPAGTYYYVLDLKNNKPKISGYVMVVR